ncbi:Yip1 family protein [Rudaea sp.]|uniref:Yip1 family protein n=1 Tax=Rudaea sp. TaxID=2136325 RepID=UPI003784F602
MIDLFNIFLEPTQVFRRLRERPTYWLPLLALSVASALFVYVYFSKVDAGWFIESSLSASAKDLSEKQVEQSSAMMPSIKALKYIGIVSAFVTTGIILAIYASYLFLVGKMVNRPISFRQGMALTAWSSMPLVLGSVMAVVAAFLMTPQTPLESLMLTHVDPLITHMPIESRWRSVAQNVDLLSFWTIGLTALGWKTGEDVTWRQATIVAALPNLVYYIGLLSFAVFR